MIFQFTVSICEELAHSNNAGAYLVDASSLAKKCMAVYQTFVSGMNQRIQKQIAVSNPFVFKHVSNLKVSSSVYG